MFEKKTKVVLKAKSNDNDGLRFTSEYKGNDGVCASMALYFAINIVKRNKLMTLNKFKSLTTDMWNEMEDINNDEN